MTRPRQISLVDLAAIIADAFEAYPQDSDSDVRGGRLFRGALVNRLRDRFGDDWVRAWNHLVERRTTQDMSP